MTCVTRYILSNVTEMHRCCRAWTWSQLTPFVADIVHNFSCWNFLLFSFYAFETSCCILTIISGSTFVLYLLTPSIVLSGIIMLSAESKTQSIFLIFILFFYYIILYYIIFYFIFFILLFFIIYIFIFHSKMIHRVQSVLFLWFSQDHMMHSLSWYPVGCLSTAACFEGPLETGLIWM